MAFADWDLWRHLQWVEDSVLQTAFAVSQMLYLTCVLSIKKFSSILLGLLRPSLDWNDILLQHVWKCWGFSSGLVYWCFLVICSFRYSDQLTGKIPSQGNVLSHSMWVFLQSCFGSCLKWSLYDIMLFRNAFSMFCCSRTVVIATTLGYAFVFGLNASIQIFRSCLQQLCFVMTRTRQEE